MNGRPSVLPDVVDGADVRVIQRGRGARLAPESLQCVRSRGSAIGQELEGDGPPEARVLGAVDDAHAAAAELLEDVIVRDRAADHLGLPRIAFHRWGGSRGSGRVRAGPPVPRVTRRSGGSQRVAPSGFE